MLHSHVETVYISGPFSSKEKTATQYPWHSMTSTRSHQATRQARRHNVQDAGNDSCTAHVNKAVLMQTPKHPNTHTYTHTTHTHTHTNTHTSHKHTHTHTHTHTLDSTLANTRKCTQTHANPHTRVHFRTFRSQRRVCVTSKPMTQHAAARHCDVRLHYKGPPAQNRRHSAHELLSTVQTLRNYTVLMRANTHKHTHTHTHTLRHAAESDQFCTRG